MKKILCPVDFTEVSRNGIEYASNLAKALEGSLTLLYVRTSIWPEAIQLAREVNESNEDLKARLTLFSDAIEEEFGIPCYFLIDSTTLTFEEAVAAHAPHFHLVVMGTNGADNYYQYLFGSNAFHVIEQVKCPVLIIPEGVSYHPIKKLVFGYDPETSPSLLMNQLKMLTAPMGTEIVVLQIGNNDIVPMEKSEIWQGGIPVSQSKVNWSFDSRNSNDIPGTLDEYMILAKADVLALSFHHRSLMAELFKENVVKRVSLIATYPVFAFWN